MSVTVFLEKEHPIAKNAYTYLVERGLVYPGSLIATKEAEAALGKKATDNAWDYLGPYLLLKTKIESEGYFITQVGIDPPGFRILDTEEMAHYAQKKLMKNLASNFKVGLIMATHDTSKLSETQKKEYKKVQGQATQSALLQQKMLFNDMYF